MKEEAGSLAEAWSSAGTCVSCFGASVISAIFLQNLVFLALVVDIQTTQRAFFKLFSLCAHIFHALQVPVLFVLVEVWLDCVKVHNIAHFSSYRFSRWELVVQRNVCFGRLSLLNGHFKSVALSHIKGCR